MLQAVRLAVPACLSDKAEHATAYEKKESKLVRYSNGDFSEASSKRYTPSKRQGQPAGRKPVTLRKRK